MKSKTVCIWEMFATIHFSKFSLYVVFRGMHRLNIYKTITYVFLCRIKEKTYV